MALVGDHIFNPNIKQIKSLQFSEDSKFLILLVSDRFRDEKGNLSQNYERCVCKGIVYDYTNYKTKVEYEFEPGVEVHKFTMSPKNPEMVCTTGPGHWKLWKV